MGKIYMISYPYEHRITSFDPERYYVRKRLESLIDRQKYLSYINVYAGTGYGKSSFVYSYLSRRNTPAVWLDAGEMFPGISVFRESLAEAISAITSAAPAGPKENLEDYILRSLFGLQSHIFLVIDHFQFIRKDAESIKFLNNLLSLELPELTLITIGTESSGLSVTRPKSHGAYLELTKEDLALTYREIEELFTHYHKIPLEKYELDLIYRETEGWIAGCQLILLYLDQNPDSTGSRLRLDYLRTLPDVYDYINYEIFEKIPRDLHDFMVKTSLLKELDPQIIDEYLGIEDSQKTLLYLRKHNFGLTETHQSKLKYPHLLRLFLYEQYHRKDPASIKKAHLKLSYIFENRYQFLDAFTHAVASMNYLRAADLMHIIYFRYNSYQILHIIDGKLDEISPLLVLPDTTLFLNRCIPEEMLQEFIPPLEASLQTALGNKELLNSVLLQHRLSGICYQLGDLKKATAMATDALESALSLKDYALAAFSLQLLADCCFEMKDYKTSMEHARQALFLTEKYNIPSIQIHCLEVLSRLQTDPQLADSYIDQALSMAAPDSYVLFWLYAAKSSVLRLSDPKAAVEWAEKAISKLSPYSCGHDLAYTHWVLAEALIACGEYGKASAHLEDAYQHSRLCALTRCHILETQIRLAEATGDEAAAGQKRSELSGHCVLCGYTWINTVPAPKPRTCDSDGFPVLTVRTLGSFSVFCSGKEISFKRAASLHIFQFLITNRGTEKNRDVISEEIFSNTKMDHLNHFHVALSALRKDLNPPDSPRGTSPYIIRNRDRYRLNMQYVRLDADEFLELSTAEYPTDEERIAALIKADELYKGDYFEEYPYEYYLEAERERLRKIRIRNLYEIAVYYTQSREYAQAANYYEKILDLDPYEDRAYLECCRVMLRIHAAQRAKKIADKMIRFVEGDMGIPCRDRLNEVFRSEYDRQES